MYVIVEIAGLQCKVEQDQQIYVNRLKAEEGETLTFDRVLLSQNGSVEVGAPVIDGMAVQAKVLEHLRGDKVIVFKKKRRKGYKVKNGYRASLTKIEITSIGAGKATKSSPKKEETKKEKPAATKAKADTSKSNATKAATEKADAEKAKTQAASAEKTAPKAKKTETASKKSEATSKKKAPATSKKSSAKGDDLKKVEGIGPKVMGIFNEAGIMTFADLAAKNPDELKEILTPHGGRYAGMTTDTWPKQAQLAADGKWEELQKWQDELDGGKQS